MADLIYLLITLASFALLALLVGVIDRRLRDPDEDAGPSLLDPADAPADAPADEAATR